MKLKRKTKGRAGFTLAETLLAVLILLLVSTIVAAGVPAARNAYYKVVLGSNAQILLSTATNALRGELGTARDIRIDDTAGRTSGSYVTYYSADTGGRSKIYKGSDGEGRTTIMLQKYTKVADFGIDSNNSDRDRDKNNRSLNYALVSEEAATRDMYITYSGITCTANTVTFTGFRVLNGSGELLAGKESNSLTIRVFPAEAQ